MADDFDFQLNKMSIKEERWIFQQKSFLEIVNPVLWIAKILGISAILVKDLNTRPTVHTQHLQC